MSEKQWPTDRVITTQVPVDALRCLQYAQASIAMIISVIPIDAAAEAEQSGDTRLPAVYLSKSLKATLAAVQASLGDQSQTVVKRGVRCLLPKHATDPDALQNASAGARPAQEDGLTAAVANHAADMSAVPNTPFGSVPAQGTSTTATADLDAAQNASVRVIPAQEDGVTAAASRRTVVLENSRWGKDVVKLLAHTEGGVTVHQAISARLTINSRRQTSAPQQMRSTTMQNKASQFGGRGHAMSALLHSKANSVSNREDLDDDVVKASVDAERDVGMQHLEPVVVLAVGPEGGWTDAELDLLTERCGFTPVTTAVSRTLDTTTAVISLVSLVFDAMHVQ